MMKPSRCWALGRTGTHSPDGNPPAWAKHYQLVRKLMGSTVALAVLLHMGQFIVDRHGMQILVVVSSIKSEIKCHGQGASG